MGVDCKIWLPTNVRLRDVANVMAILAGTKPEKKHFENCGKTTGWYCHVPYVKVEGIPNMPECASITIPDGVDGGEHLVYFHYETSDPDGYKLLMPRSTHFWVAIGAELIKFFGGKITYQDSYDDIDLAVIMGTVSHILNYEDDPSWYEMQEKMVALKPLTPQQLSGAERWAYYKPDKPARVLLECPECASTNVEFTVSCTSSKTWHQHDAPPHINDWVEKKWDVDKTEPHINPIQLHCRSCGHRWLEYTGSYGGNSAFIEKITRKD